MKKTRKPLKKLKKKSKKSPIEKPKKKLKKLKKKTKISKKAKKESNFRRVTQPEKGLTLKCLENKGSYPPSQRTFWGESVTTPAFNEVWKLWEGNLSFMTEDRKEAFFKLMVGLAESQVWEVYTLIRDLGTRIERRKSIHGKKIHDAINPPKEKKEK